MGRVPKWCLAAAKGSNNVISQQTWCNKDAKWTKNDPKVLQNHQNDYKMLPKGNQKVRNWEPKRPRDLQKGALRESIDF